MAVALAMLLPPAARSEDAPSAVADTPYASIVARNMFGLLPIPVHNPADDQPPADPPPKITPNGIMKLFGKYQALFKVANKPKPGQPAKEDSYVLAEGEMQDDIEVVKINNDDGIITFNNHGTTQELPLVAAKEGGGPPPPGSGPRFPPGFPQPPIRPGMGAFPGRAMPAGSPAFGYNAGNPNRAAGGGGGSPGAPSFGSEVNEKGIYQPAADPNPLTPEENAILLEAQRAQYLQNGNQRLADLLPPTKYTGQLNPQNDGK